MCTRHDNPQTDLQTMQITTGERQEVGIATTFVAAVSQYFIWTAVDALDGRFF